MTKRKTLTDAEVRAQLEAESDALLSKGEIYLKNKTQFYFIVSLLSFLS